MLSRVAERLYWMARYLERAENTARLLDVHQQLLLDLPADARIGWEPLLDILGSREAFEAHDDADLAVQHFILSAPDNPAALLSSLNNARENARTTRDLLPTEAWRAVNELHLYTHRQLARGNTRHRHDALIHIIGCCQQISGLLAGTMNQGPAYQFIRVGRNLERGDMTTRLIDVAAALLMTETIDTTRYTNTLWMAILRSTSGYQMYRQYVRRRVMGANVIRFLLKNDDFPRAVMHCMAEVEGALRTLPRHEEALPAASGVIRQLRDVETGKTGVSALHTLVDDLQLAINAAHDAIRTTWFLPQQAST